MVQPGFDVTLPVILFFRLRPWDMFIHEHLYRGFITRRLAGIAMPHAGSNVQLDSTGCEAIFQLPGELQRKAPVFFTMNHHHGHF